MPLRCPVSSFSVRADQIARGTAVLHGIYTLAVRFYPGSRPGHVRFPRPEFGYYRGAYRRRPLDGGTPWAALLRRPDERLERPQEIDSCARQGLPRDFAAERHAGRHRGLPRGFGAYAVAEGV